MNFLRQSTIEGLLNPAVAKSRLNAVEQLFVELTDQERADIRLIDVDKLSLRLHKIQDSSIRPEVLTLYNQRVSAALVDYFSWLEKPEVLLLGRRRQLPQGQALPGDRKGDFPRTEGAGGNHPDRQRTGAGHRFGSLARGQDGFHPEPAARPDRARSGEDRQGDPGTGPVIAGGGPR